MTYEEHLALFEKMSKEWYTENGKPEPVRKSMKNIDFQKKIRGISWWQKSDSATKHRVTNKNIDRRIIAWK